MKALILIAAAVLFTNMVKAQSAGPAELHCTEEAFTFRANIKSGWHFSAPQIGTSAIANYTSALNASQKISLMDLPLNMSLGMRAVESTNTSNTDTTNIFHPSNTMAVTEWIKIKPADEFQYPFLPGAKAANIFGSISKPRIL